MKAMLKLTLLTITLYSYFQTIVASVLSIHHNTLAQLVSKLNCSCFFKGRTHVTSSSSSSAFFKWRKKQVGPSMYFRKKQHDEMTF
jgi:hypothetical protein